MIIHPRVLVIPVIAVFILWDFLKGKCCHYVCAKNIQYQCYKVYLYASIAALMMQTFEFTKILLFICQLNDSQNSSHDEVRNDTTVSYYLRCDSPFTAAAWKQPKNRFKYICYFGVLCSTCRTCVSYMWLKLLCWKS